MILDSIDSMIQDRLASDFKQINRSTYDEWGAQVREMGCGPTRNGVPSYEKWGWGDLIQK
jgi:hypothetical protein